MSKPRYKRGGLYAADMARLSRMMAGEQGNTEELDRMKRALWKALREDVTEKQRRYLLLYYGERKSMEEIAREVGVAKSTVSRTIQRGEFRLRRCLRYGGKRFLTAGVGESEAVDRPVERLLR